MSKQIVGAPPKAREEIISEVMGTDPDKIPFYPLWDYILVRPFPKGQATKGGIQLPDGASEDDAQFGIVVKAGPGAYRESGVFIPSPVKRGDQIYFIGRFAPYIWKYDGIVYLVFSPRDSAGTATDWQKNEEIVQDMKERMVKRTNHDY